MKIHSPREMSKTGSTTTPQRFGDVFEGLLYELFNGSVYIGDVVLKKLLSCVGMKLS
jgi:hypothetical protein